MRRSLSALLLVAAVSLAGCGGDGGTGPTASLPGTYTLSTVNASALPLVVYQDADYKLEIVGGSFVIAGNGTYTETVRARETDSSGAVETPIACPGTYTRSGNTLTLTEPETDACGGTYSGTWDGHDALSVDYGGVVAVYKR